MQLTLLKAKLHQATVTHAEPDYEGSCAIDNDLLRAAGIREYEQIHLYNITGGQRLVTYAIRAEGGSGIISVNGAAAHHASPGDRVILCAYAGMSEAEAQSHQPRLVYLGPGNRIERQTGETPVQAA